MKRLIKDIEKVKNNLIEKVKLKGIYENFGQIEVMKLTEKHINSSDYSQETNKKRDLIAEFNKWCGVYNG